MFFLAKKSVDDHWEVLGGGGEITFKDCPTGHVEDINTKLKQRAIFHMFRGQMLGIQ
jgi:hypothetical protein